MTMSYGGPDFDDFYDRDGMMLPRFGPIVGDLNKLGSLLVEEIEKDLEYQETDIGRGIEAIEKFLATILTEEEVMDMAINCIVRFGIEAIEQFLADTDNLEYLWYLS